MKFVTEAPACKKLQLLLMGSFHKSLVNDCWVQRSSCARLKIAARFLPDRSLKLNIQFSTIPSTCISLTAAWHQQCDAGSELNIGACQCV